MEPKVSYTADIWYTPMQEWGVSLKRGGSVGVTNRLATLQRMATTAAMGAM